jgi:hypothetical protein
MIETTFEAQNLNFIFSIIEMKEDKIDSQYIHSFIENEADLETNQINDQTSDKLKNKRVHEQHYLFSSSSSDVSTSESSEKSVEKSSTKKTTKKKMIDLDIDTINIISEKVRRRRIERKQTYLIVLEEIADEKITSFHTAFASFIDASSFYKQTFIQALSKLKLTSSFHRDALFLESKNFDQVQRHSHAVDFNQVILTKISALRVKNT